MIEFLPIFPEEPLLQIVLLVLALILVLSILRFILRLTKRIFTCGLTLIVLFGAVLVLLRIIGIA